MIYPREYQRIEGLIQELEEMAKHEREKIAESRVRAEAYCVCRVKLMSALYAQIMANNDEGDQAAP